MAIANAVASDGVGAFALVNWRVASQAVVRLVLASAAILASVQLFRLVLLPEIQSVFELDETATSLLRRSGILLFALAAYWAYVRLVEQRRVDELRLAPARIVLGGVSGA